MADCNQTRARPPFGKAMREKEFLLDPTSIHVNHGSWGCLPREVFEERVRIMKEIEFQPDTHFRRTLENSWFEALGIVANHLQLRKENIAFVENATGCINSILKSSQFEKGDQILINTWTYNAIRNSALRTCEMTGAEVVTLDIRYPIESADFVVEEYRRMLVSHPKIKLAIIDFISSATATKFPIRDLIDLCKEHNVLSLIDGAHAPGQVPLELDNLLPDFFSGTLHKWVYCPRGTSIIWINPKHHDKIRPLVTSHRYQSKNWQEDFYYQATRDQSAYLTCPSGVQFHKSVGGIEGIQQYASPLLDKAVHYLADLWGTRTFPIPKDMEAPYLRIVRLPDLPQYPVPEIEGRVFVDLDDLISDIYSRFNIHATLLGVQGEPWIRLSANVYNYMEEYEKLGEAFLTLKTEGDKLPR